MSWISDVKNKIVGAIQDLYTNIKETGDKVGDKLHDTAVGQFAGKVMDIIYNDSKVKVSNDMYNNNPEQFSSVLNYQGQTDINILPTRTNVIPGVAMVNAGIASYKLGKNLYEFVNGSRKIDQANKGYNMYQDVNSSLSGIFEGMDEAEKKYNNKQIDYNTYYKTVKGLQDDAIKIYNNDADRYGLGKVSNVRQLANNMTFLGDLYNDFEHSIQQSQQDKSELFQPIIDKLWPETPDSVKEKERADTQLEAITKYISDDAVNKMGTIDWSTRSYQGKQLSNYQMVDTMQGLVDKIVNDEIAPLVNARVKLDSSPNFQKTVDKMIEDSTKTWKNFLDLYIDKIGTSEIQSINDYYDAYKKAYHESMEDTMGIKLTDNRRWVTVDMNTVADALVNFDRVKEIMTSDPETFGEFVKGVGGIALYGLSGIWGMSVTPAFDSAKKGIANIGRDDMLMNIDANMVKSAAFNLKPNESYNFTDMLRVAATYSSDVAEIIVPIGIEGKMTTSMFKMTDDVRKIARVSTQLAKTAKTGVRGQELLSKTSQAGKLLDTLKPSAVKRLTQASMRTVYDMTVVNAAFQSKTQEEYSSLDFWFDIGFNGMDVLLDAKRLMGPKYRLTTWDALKKSNQYKDAVARQFLMDGLGEKAGLDAWVNIKSNPTDLSQARTRATNYIKQVDTSIVLGALNGLNITDIKKSQSLKESVFKDYRDMIIAKGSVTESELADIITKNVQKIEGLSEEREKQLEDLSNLYTYEKKYQFIGTRTDTDSQLFKKLVSDDENEVNEGILQVKQELTDIDKQLSNPTTINKFSLSNRRQELSNFIDFAYATRKLNKVKEASQKQPFLGNWQYKPNNVGSDGMIDDIHTLNGDDVNKHQKSGGNGKAGGEYKYTDPNRRDVYFVTPGGKIVLTKVRKAEHVFSNGKPHLLYVFEHNNTRKEISDYTKVEVSELEKRMFDSTEEGYKQAQRYLKGYDDLSNFKPEEWKLTNEYTNTKSFVDRVLSVFRTKENGARVLSMLPEDKAGWETWFDFKGEGRAISTIDEDVTKLIVEHNGIDIFDVYQQWAEAENKAYVLQSNYVTENSMKKVKSFMDKHGISGVVDDHHMFWGDVTSEDLTKYNFTSDKVDLKSTYYPKLVNGSINDAQATVGDIERLNRNILASSHEPTLIKKAQDNLTTIKTMTYDYAGMESMNLKGTARALATLDNYWNKLANLFIGKNSDWLPKQFIEGFKEFTRISSLPTYWVDGMPIHEFFKKTFYSMDDSELKALSKDYANAIAKGGEGLTEREANIIKFMNAATAFYNDMVDVTSKYIDGYAPQKIGNVEMMKAVNAISDSKSMFHFVYFTDKETWDILTNVKKDPARYIERYGKPIQVFGNDSTVINKARGIIQELGRQGKGTWYIRGTTALLGAIGVKNAGNISRGFWNFLRSRAWIIGTTIANPHLIGSQLTLNGMGLTVDTFYAKAVGYDKNFTRKEVRNIMKTYGILYDPELFLDIIPRTTNIGGLIKQYGLGTFNQLVKRGSNAINAGVYNSIEMAFDLSFRYQKIAETLYEDYGIKNLKEFEEYIKYLGNSGGVDKFIKELNEKATRRYIYKTGNQISDLQKFAWGNTTTVTGTIYKSLMYGISLMANWGTTHIRSAFEIINGYTRNRYLLHQVEANKMSFKEASEVIEKFVQYNNDLGMLMDKLFLAFTIGRKFDLIDNSDITEETALTKLQDIVNFAKFVFAPAAALESNPVYRMVKQTIDAATSPYNEELGIDKKVSVFATFWGRLCAELKRRFPTEEALVYAFTKDREADESRGSVFFKRWKEITSGFGYFIDKDTNYYGYQADMPYTPNSELTLYLGTDWNKWKDEFMKLSTTKQLAMLQENINEKGFKKGYRDYFKYRLPIYRQREFAQFDDSEEQVDAYVVNTDERWLYGRQGILTLNGDLNRGQYVFYLLTKDNVQQFSDNSKTKSILDTMQKQYGWIDKETGELKIDAGLNQKEQGVLKSMIHSLNEGHYEAFLNEFNKTDNAKQKQGLLLMAYIQATLDAEGRGDEAPMLSKTLMASVAQDLYYDGVSDIKKALGIKYEEGKYLSDYGPTAKLLDQKLKYKIADDFGRTVYITDKTSWASWGRYLGRDRAIEEKNSEALKLFSDKFDENGDLKYGDVTAVYPTGSGKKSTSVLTNQLNNLYLLSDMWLSEGGLTNPDRFNVGLSSIIVPNSAAILQDPGKIDVLLGMSKLIAEKIDESVLPIQEKNANKAGIAAALLPIIGSVDQETIDAIGEERYRGLLNWVYGTVKGLGESALELSYRIAQKGEWEGPSAKTGTVMDYYDSMGNYGNTYWSKDYEGVNAKANKYYTKLGNYLRNNYNNLTKYSSANKSSNTYGAIESAYKNLSLRLTNAKSQGIPGGSGKGSQVPTGFTVKGSKLKSIAKKQKGGGNNGGLISNTGGLVRGSTTARQTKRYPDIVKSSE